MRLTVNSDVSLQSAIGELREAYRVNRYVTVMIKAGKGRTLDQNAVIHCWYEQLARELREQSARDWRRECKLHHGVPIMRAEDADFRDAYDTVIKPLDYAKKLQAMDFWPVTSLMRTPQLGEYMTTLQDTFKPRGVELIVKDKTP